jgi:hypothetical protein
MGCLKISPCCNHRFLFRPWQNLPFQELLIQFYSFSIWRIEANSSKCISLINIWELVVFDFSDFHFAFHFQVPNCFLSLCCGLHRRQTQGGSVSISFQLFIGRDCKRSVLKFSSTLDSCLISCNIALSWSTWVQHNWEKFLLSWHVGRFDCNQKVEMV